MTTLGPFPINKGWMADSDFWNCPPGGALTFYGFQPWANGSIKTMDGLNFNLPVSTQILGFTSWQDSAQITLQQPTFVIAVQAGGNGKIYAAQAGTFPTVTDRTGATTPDATGPYTFDTLNGKLLIFDGSTPLKLSTYNGNVANLGGTPPQGYAVKVVNNFAFVGCLPKTAATASTVYWSAVADPETWPAASNITFRQNDGDFVTALSAVNGNLLIFKNNSIGILNTTTTVISGAVTLGPLTTLTDKIGCIAPTAVDTMPDGTVVFLGPDFNIYQTDGVSVNCLSDKPAPTSNFNFIYNTLGLTAYLSIYTASLKVDRLYHRIVVTFGAQSASLNPVYFYDYYYKTWSDMTEYSNDLSTGTGSGGVTALGVLPLSTFNNFGQLSRVYFGFTKGYIAGASPYSDFQHPSLSQQWTCTFETSIQLGGLNPPPFIPRTLLIPWRQPNGGPAGNINVYIGWDGKYQSSTSGPVLFTSATTPDAHGLFSIPITQTPNSLGVMPRTMQIKIKLIANVDMPATILEPFYITDEVIQ